MPYSILPEILFARDRDPGIMLKIVEVKIENKSPHCSKYYKEYNYQFLDFWLLFH